MATKNPKLKLDTRTARRDLPVRGKPYYVKIAHGLHLGYRKGKTGGRWVLRAYVDGDYTVDAFATADDTHDADGDLVLDYWQAIAGAKARHRILAGLEDERPAGPVTVADAMADYIEYLREHRKTARDAELRNNALINPVLGHIELERLKTNQIRNWLKNLAGAPARLRTRPGETQKTRDHDPNDDEAIRRRKSSANRSLSVLRAALNRAWREGHVASDSAWRRVEPYEDVDAARVRYLDVGEAQRLLNTCGDSLRDLVHGALATGARYGELCGLDCADFDARAGTVQVRLSKTGKARHIILNDEGAALFERLTTGQPGDLAIFRKAGNQRWLRGHQARPFREAVARAKITPPISFHALRHTYASLAIMNGAVPMVVAANLGHSDTRMVERHYGHLSNKFKTEMIRATAPVFGIDDKSNVERLGVSQ